MVPYTVWDVETTITTSFKRKANPFDPANFVVMSGYKRGGQGQAWIVQGDYFGRQPKPANWFTKLLNGTKILVGQNIKFDLLHALMDAEHSTTNLKAWMAWVADGGLVWDIQLAEYLLEGMTPESQMLSLNELAIKYGGNVKHDEVAALWAAGVQTYDINVDLLRSYLCGDETGQGDIGNTELVFLGQYERAKAAKQVKSILLNMGSLLCTIEMERNGMKIALEEGYRQAGVLAEQLVEFGLELAEFIPADLPFEFNWNSNYHKSALVFGGAIKYQAKAPVLDEDGNLTYYQKKTTAYQLLDGQWVPELQVDILDDGWVRYNSGKNKGEFKTKQVIVLDYERGHKERYEDFIYDFPGYAMPNRSWRGEQLDARGVNIFSLDTKVMEELALDDDIPFIKALSKVISLRKDLGTYYITTDEKTGEQKGMLTLVQIDGIIHHMLNHTSTVTARFSSSNPNLQNIPTGAKSQVKTLFISRFANGVIIQSDFSSLEVYIQAILTQCKQLILDLKAGLDMHCVRVSQKENVTYEEAVLKCKGTKECPADPVWVKKRKGAKSFSFERAYGAGAAKISKGNKIPLEEVEAMIVAENERYPEIERFYEGVTKEIKANSQPSGKRMPHPEFPGVMCFFRNSYYRTPDNKLYTYRESTSPEYLVRKGTSTSFSPTEIKNYIVQGEGGEWAKAAMWIAIRAYYSRGNFGGLALLVNQVHDALYSDADRAVAYEAAVILEASMVAASEFMEWYFGWEVPVPVPSETKWGKSMMDEEDIPGNFRADVEIARKALRADYMKGYVPSWELNS